MPSFALPLDGRRAGRGSLKFRWSVYRHLRRTGVKREAAWHAFQIARPINRD